MSFINNNKYFKESISEELGKMGYNELENSDTPGKIFYCDINYGERQNPDFSKCEVVNQLQDVNPLGNKKDQYDLHLKYYKKRPDYIPFTASFNRSNVNQIGYLFESNPREAPKIYILKPENDSFRNGVGLVKSMMELVAHLDSYDMYDDWIIQDYIGNPLLLNGKKFHFRIYVIYIQTSVYQVAYLSDVGFIYTANKEFHEDTTDEDVVLSGESSPANVFYVPDDFQKNFGKSVWQQEVLPQIVKITRETLKSVLDMLSCPNNKQKCFKILGYDILIDDNYRCYLAEINARGVTYKYPNKNFLNTFYRNILKLVMTNEPLNNKQLKELNIPYERILYKKEGVMVEGFRGMMGLERFDNMIGEDRLGKKVKFNSYYWGMILPFLVFILLLIIVQSHWRR